MSFGAVEGEPAARLESLTVGEIAGHPIGGLPFTQQRLAITGVDVSDVEVRCEDNDEVRQLGRTKDMVFDVPTLVSYISHVMTLLPGDVVLTGTPAGVSQLNDGDLVTVSVEGVGALTNRVLSLE